MPPNGEYLVVKASVTVVIWKYSHRHNKWPKLFRTVHEFRSNLLHKCVAEIRFTMPFKTRKRAITRVCFAFMESQDIRNCLCSFRSSCLKLSEQATIRAEIVNLIDICTRFLY